MTNRTITDIKGNIHTIDLEHTTVSEFKHKYPHWGWWVLWVLIFYPALVVLFFMRQKVAVVHSNGYETLVTEATGVSLLNEIDTLKNSKKE